MGKAAQARRVAADLWRGGSAAVSRWGVLGGGLGGALREGAAGVVAGAESTWVSALVCPASCPPARLFSVWLWDLAHGFCGRLLRTLLSFTKAVWLFV